MSKGENQEGKSGAGIKPLMLMIIGALLLVAGSVGVTMLLIGGGDSAAEGGTGGSAQAAEPPAENGKEKSGSQAHYFSIDPPFIVNFKSDGNGRVRYLKVELEALTYDEAIFEDVRKHMPVIRNNLVMLFSKQSYSALLEPEAKEALRAETLAEIQKVMQERIGQTAVEDVFFTSFVMQ